MDTIDKLNELFYDIPYDKVKQRFSESLSPENPNNDTGYEETPIVTDGFEEVELVRVIDGDTMIVKRNGSNEEINVRFLSIDTPEISGEDGSQPFGPEAKLFLEEFLKNDVAYLEFEGSEQTDSYGRLLAHVYNDEGLSAQEALLSRGLGQVRYTQEGSLHYDTYKQAETIAKENSTNIWETSGYATDTGFIPTIYANAGISRERYLATSLSDNEEGFHSEAKNLGGKQAFKATKYKRSTYTSFSGADIKISISFKGGEPVVVGEAQTLSYSLFRPMEPVYALGSAKPRGFVRGPRTIAGSIIFTVFDRNVLLDKFYKAYEKAKATCTDRNYLTDELPPFDIHAVFMNEYGMRAHLVIHGIYISSEGQVMSIEDMITENTMQYVATDITLMRPGVE